MLPDPPPAAWLPWSYKDTVARIAHGGEPSTSTTAPGPTPLTPLDRVVGRRHARAPGDHRALTTPARLPKGHSSLGAAAGPPR
jgi:hypothetical protein